MPAWSEEIAYQFVILASDDRQEVTQLQLQKLIYIAHGWRLFTSGQPLTGDRPEAAPFGPAYRRLSERLAICGLEPVQKDLLPKPDASALDAREMEMIAAVWNSHRGLTAEQLSGVTRSSCAPWSMIWAGGRGSGQEISHQLIRQQFAAIARLQDGDRLAEADRSHGKAKNDG